MLLLCLRLMVINMMLYLQEKSAHAAVFAEKNETRSSFIETIMSDPGLVIKPNFDEGISTIVDLNVFISSIDEVNEQEMMWTDGRLAFNASKLGLDKIEVPERLFAKTWRPSLYFVNEKSAYHHDVTIPNRYVDIDKNGRVLYSMRASVTLSCAMQLQAFPFDSQRCPMLMESYSYSTIDVIYRPPANGPIIFSKSIRMSEFSLREEDTESRTTMSEYMTGNFSGITVTILIERKIAYYITQHFIPQGLIVVLSWVGFWISYEAVPARITLGAITILTISTQSTGMAAKLPQVSYIKAIDVWSSVCLAFVFAALLEFVAVSYCAIRQKDSKEAASTNTPRTDVVQAKVTEKVGIEQTPVVPHSAGRTADTATQTDEILNSPQATAYRKGAILRNCPTFRKWLQAETENIAQEVERKARIAFPVSFLIFNIYFWIRWTTVASIEAADE